MDLLNAKKALVSVCLLGAVLLVADENGSDEVPVRLKQNAEQAQELKTTVSSDKKEHSQETTQSKTPSNQATDLKPLELKERIRAHANIDLPQDI
ncbi:MAG: hypothetical protein OXG05_09475 [Gammaproteobacteria bacterium]|nr:hypothetical protein [Gammaproteobacteria bacterium]